MAGAHPPASLSLCFAVILKGLWEWGGFHSTTECPELKAPTRIIESSSSVHGPHRDQSHTLGVISPCCDPRKPGVTQFLPHSTQTLKPLCFLGSQRTPWQPQQDPPSWLSCTRVARPDPGAASRQRFWDLSGISPEMALVEVPVPQLMPEAAAPWPCTGCPRTPGLGFCSPPEFGQLLVPVLAQGPHSQCSSWLRPQLPSQVESDP